MQILNIGLEIDLGNRMFEVWAMSGIACDYLQCLLR